MKVGDLVRYKAHDRGATTAPGLVVHMTQKKVWRTHLQGPKVNWAQIDPEPHAGVLYAHNDDTVDIPVIDLEVVNESR